MSGIPQAPDSAAIRRTDRPFLRECSMTASGPVNTGLVCGAAVEMRYR